MITDTSSTQAKFTVIRWPELEDKPTAYLVWCIRTAPVYNDVVYCSLDRSKAEAERDRLQEKYATFCLNYCIEEIELS